IVGSVVSGPVGSATNASNLTGGTVSGVNTISGRLVVGNPAAAHVVVGTDGAGAAGVQPLASDGGTPLIDLNIGAPMVAGSVVSGPVASAPTRRSSDLIVGSVVSGPVGSATNASNLTGGTVSGVNTISGRLVVGNPAASHVVVG